MVGVTTARVARFFVIFPTLGNRLTTQRWLDGASSLDSVNLDAAHSLSSQAEVHAKSGWFTKLARVKDSYFWACTLNLGCFSYIQIE